MHFIRKSKRFGYLLLIGFLSRTLVETFSRMPTRWYRECGKVQVRILKWPFENGIYYDEYVPFRHRNNPNANVFIPVESGDLYAIEVTFFEGFEMGTKTHLRCRLYHPGQLKGPLRLVTLSYQGDDERPERLDQDIVEVIDRRPECTIDGVKRRDVMFAVEGLTPGKNSSSSKQVELILILSC